MTIVHVVCSQAWSTNACEGHMFNEDSLFFKPGQFSSRIFQTCFSLKQHFPKGSMVLSVILYITGLTEAVPAACKIKATSEIQVFAISISLLLAIFEIRYKDIKRFPIPSQKTIAKQTKYVQQFRIYFWFLKLRLKLSFAGVNDKLLKYVFRFSSARYTLKYSTAKSTVGEK